MREVAPNQYQRFGGEWPTGTGIPVHVLSLYTVLDEVYHKYRGSLASHIVARIRSRYPHTITRLAIFRAIMLYSCWLLITNMCRMFQVLRAPNT